MISLVVFALLSFLVAIACSHIDMRRGTRLGVTVVFALAAPVLVQAVISRAHRGSLDLFTVGTASFLALPWLFSFVGAALGLLVAYVRRHTFAKSRPSI